jgi:LysM repeat protein
MTFSAIPPHNLQLQLQKRTPNGNNSNYIIVRIYYPLPNSLRLTVNNKVVKPGVLTDYNNATSLLNNLNRSQCGSNIYFYANTTITFVLTEDPDCTAVISVVDSISLTTHFAVDINTFFSSNAISSFINNLCAILKITDTSRVKVVGVYSGSTIVNTVIEAESTTGNTTVSNSSTTSNASSLTEINNLLNSNINSGVFASTMASIAPVQAVVALVNYVDNGSGKD